MVVWNILLAAFLVRNEIRRPGAPAASTAAPLERPTAGSSPQLNAPPNQGSSLGLKTPPVEVRPAALPSAQMSQRPSIKSLPKALRASKTRRPVLLATMPRTVISAPPQPLGQTPAPVRDQAASSRASVAAAPPRLTATSGIGTGGVPVTGARVNAGQPHNAPAASALSPSTIGSGLTAKGSQSGSVAKVAAVGLPAMEKQLFVPKMPVAPVSPKMEIVPRPAVKVENCGDDKVFIACPTLKIRYDTPYTTQDP
jgi:hypothetical protein